MGVRQSPDSTWLSPSGKPKTQQATTEKNAYCVFFKNQYLQRWQKNYTEYSSLRLQHLKDKGWGVPVTQDTEAVRSRSLLCHPALLTHVLPVSVKQPQSFPAHVKPTGTAPSSELPGHFEGLFCWHLKHFDSHCNCPHAQRTYPAGPGFPRGQSLYLIHLHVPCTQCSKKEPIDINKSWSTGRAGFLYNHRA